MSDTKESLKKLNESFGSYKAEWLRNQIFELFAEPSYFPALQDNRPCVLEGGRGDESEGEMGDRLINGNIWDSRFLKDKKICSARL
jgi:hypothetical protein